MKRPYQIAGVVLLLFSAYIGRESLELKFYTTLGPGPGFFPFWLSVLMGLLAANMLYQATFKDAGPMPEDFYASRVGYLRAIAVCVSMVGVVILMERIGFRWTMALFFAFLLMTLGRPNPADAVLVVIAGSLGTFRLFNNSLQVPLPVGPFDDPLAVATDWVVGPLGVVLLVIYVVYRTGFYRSLLRLQPKSADTIPATTATATTSTVEQEG